MKKVIAFDLDDTLAISKSPISDHMAELLPRLAEKFEICIISGGKFEQFVLQVTERLQAGPKIFNKFHLMPTCGTRYYRYDEPKGDWALQYAEDLTEDQKAKIIKILEEEAEKIDLKNKKIWGPIIEDRKSQIAYSILGQQAPPEEKYKWADKNTEIKKIFHAAVVERLPEFEVRMGGTTTIDITKLGIDKAYGIKKLMEALKIEMEDILFIGDRLEEGGNDYPVKAMGIDSMQISHSKETELAIEAIILTV